MGYGEARILDPFTSVPAFPYQKGFTVAYSHNTLLLHTAFPPQSSNGVLYKGASILYRHFTDWETEEDSHVFISGVLHPMAALYRGRLQIPFKPSPQNTPTRPIMGQPLSPVASWGGQAAQVQCWV